MSELGYAAPHPDTWAFIAHQLLLHGSFLVNIEYGDTVIPVLFTLPYLPFTSQSLVYAVVIDQGLVVRTYTQEPYHRECLSGDASHEIVLELHSYLQQIVLHL